MTSSDPSIGVMMPTLNCAALLPAHIESAREWLDLAAEVVVVDSDSTDGTIAYLKENLRHPNVRFLQHPRGIYQSWNHGIKNISQKYTYISTVGDSITRAGLLRMHEVAETTGCDAVVSKPHFIDNEGRPLPDLVWPVDRVWKHLPGREQVRLEGLVLLLFAIIEIRGGILGSSASDLYLTRTLADRPFPTDHGYVGDLAWVLANALDVRLEIMSDRYSTFRFHPKAYAMSDYELPNLMDRLLKLADATLALARKRAPELQARAQTLRLEETIRARRESLASQAQLEACRNSRWPWMLNPTAWKARASRRQCERILAELAANAAAQTK